MSDYLIQIFNLISKRPITEVGILFSYLNHHYKEFDCEDYFIIRKLLKDLEESYLDTDFYLLYDINNNFQNEYQLLLLKSLEDEIKKYDKKKKDLSEQKNQDNEQIEIKVEQEKESLKQQKTKANKKKSYAAVTKKSVKKNNESDEEIII